MGSQRYLVALTGWGQAQDKEAARAAGFDEHLTKPIDPAVLEALLWRALASAESPPPPTHPLIQVSRTAIPRGGDCESLRVPGCAG